MAEGRSRRSSPFRPLLLVLRLITGLAHDTKSSSSSSSASSSSSCSTGNKSSSFVEVVVSSRRGGLYVARSSRGQGTHQARAYSCQPSIDGSLPKTSALYPLRPSGRHWPQQINTAFEIGQHICPRTILATPSLCPFFGLNQLQEPGMSLLQLWELLHDLLRRDLVLLRQIGIQQSLTALIPL